MNKFCTLIIIAFVIPVSLKAQKLSGKYTIGGNTASYSTISAAVAALNTNGISGNVVFNIRPGKYTEQFTINNITGVSSSDTIIFQSEKQDTSSVTIENAGTPGADYVVKLNHAKGITFRHITFKNSSPTNCIIIYFINNNKNIHFESNQFIAPEVTNYTDTLNLLYSYNQQDTAISIKDNYFEGGNYGIRMDGYLSSASKTIEIKNNKFRKQYQGAIAVYHFVSIVIISDNDIDITGFGGTVAIDCRNILDLVAIENNRIEIQLGTALTVNTCHATSVNDLKVFNNRIYKHSAYTGIAFYNSHNGKIINNTIYSNHNNALEYAIDLQYYYNTAIENNLFVNDNGGALISEKDNNGSTINFNAYAGNFLLGTSNSVNYNTLTDWQALTFDLQSSSCPLPTFVNNDFSELKLSCNNSTLLKRSVTTKATVPFDYEGETRPNSGLVWCGADEYHPGNEHTYITGLISYGNNTVKSGTVILYADISAKHKWDKVATTTINIDGTYKFNGVTPLKYMLQVVPNSTAYPNLIPTYHDGQFNWNPLTAFISDSCHLTIVNVSVIELMTISAGNAVITGYVYNDGSFKTNDPIPGLDIVLDKIPPVNPVQKTTTDATGKYVFKYVPLGNYQVNIDVAGIGLKSIYTIDVTNNDSVYSKRDYCVDSLAYTCFGASSVQTINKKILEIKVWPNPIQNELKIQFPEGKELYRVDIYDIVGNQIYSKVNTGDVKLMEVDFTTIPEGIYIVKISSENSVMEMKLIK